MNNYHEATMLLETITQCNDSILMNIEVRIDHTKQGNNYVCRMFILLTRN